MRQLQGSIGGPEFGLQGGNFGLTAVFGEIVDLVASGVATGLGFGKRKRIRVRLDGKEDLSFLAATTARAVERLEIAGLRCRQIQVFAFDVALVSGGLLVAAGGEKRHDDGGEQKGMP